MVWDMRMNMFSRTGRMFRTFSKVWVNKFGTYAVLKSSHEVFLMNVLRLELVELGEWDEELVSVFWSKNEHCLFLVNAKQ